MGDPSAANQWEPVSFSKRPGGGAPVKAAKNSRGGTEGVEKCESLQPLPGFYCLLNCNLGLCAVDRSTSDKNRKLDESDEAGRIEKVSVELCKKIMQARMAKKMTQVSPHTL
jgi:hypothetical protein